ncbi:MAG: carboxymuconolactone decarboxylase family protein [Acidobacteria bacterium]|nr:carboxymuconolactone decarboxylase family protein [Acidobacteriota bacterium]
MMKTKVPEVPAAFARQHPTVWRSFENLANQCHEAGPLDAKAQRLVKLGIAVGAGLEGGVHAQVRNALAEGITPDELRHVIVLGLTTIGFPASMAALTWVNDYAGKKTKRTGRGK